MVNYQVRVHIAHNGTHGVAEFPSMTEAYLYLIETIAQLVLYVPMVKDAEWVDDELVRLVGHNGEILGTCTVIMAESDTIIH